MIDYTGTTSKAYIYIMDVHGNIIGLADNTGIVVNYEYDAWGNLLNTPETVLTGNGENLADANPFRYSGYQFDKETGLYYLKYRYYVPSLGRFLTRDPMLTSNRYVYCRNNPVLCFLRGVIENIVNSNKSV
jgi:RHS repeat-associated protein